MPDTEHQSTPAEQGYELAAAAARHDQSLVADSWRRVVADRDAEIARLRAALKEVDRLCPRPGGAGQVARDALRIGA
jgi:hypothetical protein